MSRPTLVRGVSALIPDDLLVDPEPASRGALRVVPIDRIQPNPEQPRMRFSGVALEQLAESIKTHGVLTPLLVRRVSDGEGTGERYVLIAGERRLRASGLAGLDEVPVCIREDVASRAQLELALVENLQREDLDPIETATSYQRLVEEFGLTQAEVARRVGKDRATVANAIRLLRLPEFALIELRAGRITAGHAKALLGLDDDEVLRSALLEVTSKDLSVRATERLVAGMANTRRRRARSRDLAFKRLGTALSSNLGTRVQVRGRARGQGGRIILDFHDPDQLDQLVQLLEQGLPEARAAGPFAETA